MGTVDGILMKVTPQSSYLSACTRFWATPPQKQGFSYCPEAPGKLRQSFEMASCSKSVEL